MFVRVCVCVGGGVCGGWLVCDGESAMAVKSLGTAVHGGRTRRRRTCGEELGGRWLVVAAVGGRRWCREEKRRK